MRGGIRRGAELSHLPDLSWTSRRVAGDESRSAANDRANRFDARLRYCAYLQVRSEELFLSRHAEELSDLAVRHAALPKWRRAVARSGVSQGSAKEYRNAGQ